MSEFGVILIFIVGLLVGGALGALVMLLRSRSSSEGDIAQRGAAEAQVRFTREQLVTRDQDLSAVRAENTRLQGETARLQQARLDDAEKLAWVDQAQVKLREAFEALSSRTLQANSATFGENARSQLGDLMQRVQGDWNTQKVEMHGLVDPLQQNLATLDQRMRELEEKREGAYQRVDEQLNQIIKVNADLQRTTITLAQALKSSSVRGRWGELQLRRIAELSGMHEHISFEEQVSVEDGRPDMLVYLPNGGSIPIDSKTPMTSFIEAVETNDDATRKAKLAQHVKAMRARVGELGQKKYWESVKHAADFVVMFVPSEACLSAAFDADPLLMEDALNLKVMVVTPITLLALLKTVAYGWQQHRINEEAMLIAEEGRTFYQRLKVFVDYLSDMRGSLTRTVENYNKAIGSLEGRLLPSVRKLEAMAATGKPLEVPQLIEVAPRQLAGD